MLSLYQNIKTFDAKIKILAFSVKNHFKANEKTKVSPKTLLEIFTIGYLPFKRMVSSCRTITGDFERIHFFNLGTDFLKNESVF